MPLIRKLDQSLKVYDEDSDVEPYSDELEASSPSILDTGEGQASIRGDNSDVEHSHHGADDDVNEGDSWEDDSPEGHEDIKKQISKTSFATLSKAQSTLGKRKRVVHDTSEEKLTALRERLRELKRNKSGRVESGQKKELALDEASPEPEPATRTSKHAPAFQSSNRAVSRKRTIFAPPKAPSLGDPRFSTLAGSVDANRVKQNYSFLNTYRDAEIRELRDSITAGKSKTSKVSERDKEALAKKLLSLESKKKADEGKERQAKILREHRRKEKEAVKEGKKPFYLKKSEQKKLVLVDKFQSMKARERDHAIERRRKKDAGKEKKRMPSARRTVDA